MMGRLAASLHQFLFRADSAKRDAWQLLRSSGLFDEAWYRQRCPDVDTAGFDPLIHYLEFGASEGRSPNPLFDAEWYRVRVAELGQNEAPLLHFAREGWRRGYQPHPLFDMVYYRELHPGAVAPDRNPLEHFLREGEPQGFDPHPLFWTAFYRSRIPASESRPVAHFLSGNGDISPHPLFDPAFYRSTAPVEGNALVHYLRAGATEGRDPHPLFSTSYYATRYRSMLQGMNPLQHYAKFGGVLMHQRPHVLFDPEYYLSRRPEAARPGLPLLIDFLNAGAAAGADPHPLFRIAYYKEQVPELAASGVDPVSHYLTVGWKAGRSPHPLFDSAWYATQHSDLTVSPLEHYLRHCFEPGCDPSPRFHTSEYLGTSGPLRAGQTPLEHYLEHHPDGTGEIPGSAHLAESSNSARFTWKDVARQSGSGFDAFVDLSESAPGDARAWLASTVLAAEVCTVVVLSLSTVPVVPSHWRIIAAPHSAAAAAESLREAAVAGVDWLMLLGCFEVPASRVEGLRAVLAADPLFGSVAARIAGSSRQHVRGLALHRNRSIPTPSLARVPEFYILPEYVDDVLLIRRELVSDFVASPEWKTPTGVVADLLYRARRVGFRSVAANRVVVPGLDPQSHAARLGVHADLRRLEMEHPDFLRARQETERLPLHTRETLLTAPPRSLLVDARGMAAGYNGTSELITGLLDGMYAVNREWKITVLVNPGVDAFHGLSARYPDFAITAARDPGIHELSFSASQPWYPDTLREAHRRSLTNVYFVYDTIAWDVLYPAPEQLTDTLQRLARTADGLVYLSHFTQQRFETRFPRARSTQAHICRPSMSPDEYVDETLATRDEGYLLVAGNEYDHKAVEPTVHALRKAFPDRKIRVTGPVRDGGLHVTGLPIGDVPQRLIDSFYAGARAVIFPSYYEGFGFPMVRGLSYGKPVLVRESALADEIAALYRGPGTLLKFRTQQELVEQVAAILQNKPISGTTFPGELSGRGWRESASGLLAWLREIADTTPNPCHWEDRETGV